MKKILSRLKYGHNLHIFYCFLIPILFFMFSIFIYQLYPLGNNALIPYDSQHQYVPFLQEFKNKILNGEGFFFSKRMASTDFYLEWLYYLTSPFNIIVLFIKDIYFAFEVIVILKICCIGASMAAYLKKRYGGAGFSVSAFALAYSMSGYVMSYYFSIMWLDILMLFPWLILAFEYLINNKKPWLYSLILAAIIYSNFFMAMHVCIFLCIWFLINSQSNGVKDFIKNGLRFAAYSIIGGLIGTVFFLPFISMVGDKAGEIPSVYFLTNFADLFLSFGAGAEKHTSMDYTSNANFYCGIIVFILFLLYMTNKRFDIRNRLKNLLIVLFLFLCTNISFLDFFMNGFYETNGYMGRYTYIIIFFIISGAYQEFLVFRNDSKAKKIAASIATMTLFLVSFVYLFIIQDIEDWHMLASSISILICMLFILVSCTYFFDNRKNGLAAILVVEIMCTALCGMLSSNMENIFNTQASVEELFEETDNRVAILDADIENEEILFGMNGINLFSSSMPETVSRPPYRFGLRGGNNYITAYGCELIPSMFYNIQYIYGTDDEYVGFTKIKEAEKVSLFENNYKTSYAYAVPKSLTNFEWDTLNTFKNLNKFASYFTNKRIFTSIDKSNIFLESDYEKASGGIGSYGDYEVSFKKGAGSHIEVSTIAENSNIAVNIKNGRLSKCTIYINDEIYISSTKIEGDTIFIKGVEEGDKISVYMDAKKEEGVIKVAFAYYNIEAFDEFAKELESRIIDVSFEDNKLSCDYDIEENEAILISIPNINGWEALINGEKIQTEDFPYILITPVSKEGSLEMCYITPYFKVGLIVTLTAMLILLILVILHNRKN